MKKLAVLILAVACAFSAAPAPVAQAAPYERCQSVSNPYPDTRFEGTPLSRVRAQNVSCGVARRVARGAHRKALAQPPTPTLMFKWRGWKVRGDIRGAQDDYRARRGNKRVRWVF